MNPAAVLIGKCIERMQGAVPNLLDFTYRDNVNENMYPTQCLARGHRPGNPVPGVG